MTSLPAQTFGFRDRGMVREGFAADLVIFDEKTIEDRATFDKPHQFPVGVSYVFVNGELVFANGQMTGARPGVALAGSGHSKKNTDSLSRRFKLAIARVLMRFPDTGNYSC
jgi:N-acyl-D-amino-acid deacylase